MASAVALQGQGCRAGQPPQVRCSRDLLRAPLPRRHRRPPPVQHPGQGGQPLRRRRRRRLQRPRPRHPQLLLAGRARPARRADEHGQSAVSDGDRPLFHCWGVAARTLGGQGGRRRGVPQGLKVPMPGLTKEHVKVHAEKNILVIKGEGEKQPWDGDDDSAVPRYNRRIEMPADAYKMDKIKAEMKNGVLWVTLLKVKEEEGKNVFHVKVE